MNRPTGRIFVGERLGKVMCGLTEFDPNRTEERMNHETPRDRDAQVRQQCDRYMTGKAPWLEPKPSGETKPPTEPSVPQKAEES